MAVDEQATFEPAPQIGAGPADLLDDAGDGDVRTEIVARNRDRDALRE